jgi:hypothetical protein
MIDIILNTTPDIYKSYSATECMNYCVESAKVFYSNDLDKFFIIICVLVCILIGIRMCIKYVVDETTSRYVTYFFNTVPYLILLVCFYYFYISH